MGIRKIGGRFYVVHHTVKGKIGKPVASNPRGGHRTYANALRQHKAIMWRRHE